MPDASAIQQGRSSALLSHDSSQYVYGSTSIEHVVHDSVLHNEEGLHARLDYGLLSESAAPTLGLAKR
jgi:hypothetical protein